METEKIEIKTLIISIAGILSIEVATRVVISKGLYDPMMTLGAARLFEIILIVLIILIWGKGLSSIGLAPSKISLGIKKGLIWSAGFGMFAFLVFAGLFAAGINTLPLIETRLPTNGSDVILFFLVGGMVAPIAEELFFRGMIYGFFRRWGVLMALAMSTLIFVLSHSMNHHFPVTQMVGGILFAVAYEVEGSLMVPITIHILGNMAIFTLSLIS